jgi:hypothetical protein
VGQSVDRSPRGVESLAGAARSLRSSPIDSKTSAAPASRIASPRLLTGQRRDDLVAADADVAMDLP